MRGFHRQVEPQLRRHQNLQFYCARKIGGQGRARFFYFGKDRTNAAQRFAAVRDKLKAGIAPW